MTIISHTCLPRRAILRGLGAAIALPLLDGMVPALAAIANTVKPPRRLGAIYVPNGIQMVNWTPAREGPAFELTPILEPLAAFREQMLLVSGLDNKVADAYTGEGAGDHSRGPASWLSGVHIKKTDGADLEAGMTIDQIIARELGKETQLASLELSLESSNLLGACDVGYSCAYQGTISWRTPTMPLPMENDPRRVFERLFGGSDTTDARARQLQLQEDRSILDSVTEKVARLGRQLGPHDRAKLSGYLDAIRDIERQIQRAESQSARELPAVEQPEGVPSTFEAYAKLMLDLQVLAYQADVTRVVTMMVARETSARTYPEIGVNDPHHPTSHHQNDPEKMAKNTKINAYHTKLFAYFLEKLRSTREGDGSLLDNVTMLYGAGISDGDAHTHIDMPTLLVGGGVTKQGRHVKVAKGTPLTNLHLAILARMGLSEDRLGDSTGQLGLFDV
jgi:hypothetical protein